MTFNKEVKDKIEDALIHFEDAGYKFNINHDFFCASSFETKHENQVYDLLKKVGTNEEVEFGERIYINLLQKRSVMNWVEYQWFQSELRQAIRRITGNFDNVSIRSASLETSIEIIERRWNFKNIRQLTEKTRYFNYNNNDKSNLVIYPEFHVDEGIVLYVREILTEPGEKRFDILNYMLKGDNVNVTIERAFGKDCVVKTYEEGEAERENNYLSGHLLSKFIVAKLNSDFIKV